MTFTEIGPATLNDALDAKLLIRDLDFFYGQSRALKGINLALRPKEVTAFIGPSGCG